MTPSNASTIQPRVAVATLPPLRAASKSLDFKPITLVDIPAINRLLQFSHSRSCDYTIGGILMWVDWLRYEYCILDDTLFIKGVSEADDITPAFSLPIGAMDMHEAVDLIRDYCHRNDLVMRFSAIPADRLASIESTDDFMVTPLLDFTDYIYNIEELATLPGKKFSKKRNHVHRFFADNPDARLEPLTKDDVEDVIAAYRRWTSTSPLTAPTAIEEGRMTEEVLRNLEAYPFEGAKLVDGRGKIVAFTLAEVIGDTLHVHIEKMDHTVAGAGETVNHLFAAEMLRRHPQLVYANRQDDSGDPGLRRAKESYNPAYLLPKFECVAQNI